MPEDLLQIVESTTLDGETIAAKTAMVHAEVLGKSRYITAANFKQVHPNDLQLLFDIYDDQFFQGQIRRELGDTPLHFRLSKRMTSSGGKTASYRRRGDPGSRWFEITASTALLFQCFAGEDHRPIVCSGITCRDRLDALQRVMEHEITHLIEMLLWEDSSCRKPRFHSVTRRFFGHTENNHKLITPREHALVKFGVQPGSRVRFRFDGAEHTGVVNRINKRATVLVEDADGERYSDGKKYMKYYIPVQMLEVVE